LFLLFCVLACRSAAVRAADDIIFADFEGETYGDWKVEGTAFGSRPASGTLPNQMEVAGFQGRGLANSFVGVDNHRGRLISPLFSVQRKFIAF
jgi:hypothetical protein